MRLARAASWAHKWLAVIIGVQVLLWVASGLFFAAYPIERVRSEHRIAEHNYPALDMATLASPADIASLLAAAPASLVYERDAAGRAVVVAQMAEGRPVLIDAAARRVLSPLDEAGARVIAQAYVARPPAVREARLVNAETPEYRGALPAWRLAFADAEGLVVYVAADTGRVTARRSDLWRLYDALWALHIMDWRDHENFNTGLLIASAFAALVAIVSGFVLLPYRLLPRPKR